MSLYENVGKVVTVLVDPTLIYNADPANGIGIVRDDEGSAIEITGLLRSVDVSWKAELVVGDDHVVTFDIDDATELVGPSVRS